MTVSDLLPRFLAALIGTENPRGMGERKRRSRTQREREREKEEFQLRYSCGPLELWGPPANLAPIKKKCPVLKNPRKMPAIFNICIIKYDL